MPGRVTRAAAAAVLAAAAAGCGVSKHAAPAGGVEGTVAVADAGWADAAELTWLRHFGVWQRNLVEQARRIPQTTAQNGLAAALTPLAACGDTFRSDVGPSPTARLRRVEVLVRRSCAEWRRASMRTLDSGGEAGPDVVRHLRRATRLLRRANELLPPGAQRPLGEGRPSDSQSGVVPEFGRVASKLAGHRVEVRCWSRSDWPRLLREARELSVSRLDERTAGFTPVGGSKINLGPDGCLALGALVFDRARPTGADTILYAAGVEMLSHESQHARGFADEAVTECRGIQLLRPTAVALGLSAPLAARLAEVFWSHYDDEPPGYATARCHDGGPLDLHPASHRWP